MTAKLLTAVVVLLAGLHGHLTVAGAAVAVRPLVLIVLLALCAAAVAAVAPQVLAFRSSPFPRPTRLKATAA